MGSADALLSCSAGWQGRGCSWAWCSRWRPSWARSWSASLSGVPVAGGVRGEGEAGLRGQFHGVEVEGDDADGGVAEPLAACVVQAHVVLGPGGAEVLAADDELVDGAGQLTVVGARPASVRSRETVVSRDWSQSGKKSGRRGAGTGSGRC